ncbi:hypothetical protein ACSSS7_006543 [Eimeria intestinalis]
MVETNSRIFFSVEENDCFKEKWVSQHRSLIQYPPVLLIRTGGICRSASRGIYPHLKDTHSSSMSVPWKKLNEPALRALLDTVTDDGLASAILNSRLCRHHHGTTLAWPSLAASPFPRLPPESVRLFKAFENALASRWRQKGKRSALEPQTAARFPVHLFYIKDRVQTSGSLRVYGFPTNLYSFTLLWQAPARLHAFCCLYGQTPFRQLSFECCVRPAHHLRTTAQEKRMRMSHAPTPCDFATLLSQQRLLRQQEQQVRGELLRLSRAQPFALPEDRPLSPPPPQKPLERRSFLRGPHCVNDYLLADGFNRRPSAGRGIRPERWQLRSMSAAVTQRQREVQQEQLERRRKLLCQQQLAPPASLFGEAALARLQTHPYEISPYSFDLVEAREKFGKVRSVASPVLDAYAIKNEVGRRHRQQEGVSPRSLPAAGMPSGHGRAGEDCTEKRQRRQVVPPHDAESPLHSAAGGSQWPARDQRSFRRPQSLSGPPSGDLNGYVGNSKKQALPSTSPPALHPEPDFRASFYHHRTYGEQVGRHVSPGGPRARYWDEWPRGIYRDQQLQEPSVRQPYAAQQCYVEQVAAGMPSSKITRDAYDFRQSLRAETEPKASGIRSAAVPVHSKYTGIGNRFVSSQANPRLVLSDDEETLRDLGLNLSPRELLFFKKQPSLRRKQLMTTHRKRGERPDEVDGATGSAVPAGKCGVARQQGDRLAVAPWRGDLRSTPMTIALSLPSWMRAYGLASTPPKSQPRTGAAQRHVSVMGAAAFQREGLPLLMGEDEAALLKLGGRDAPRCGCRCCCLRESGVTGVNSAGQQPCCCCPCCSAWIMRASERPASASDSSPDPREDTGAASAAASSVAGAKSKCFRCGEWSEVKASSGGSVGPTKRSPDGSAGSVLCEACATYLECERRRSAGVGAGSVGGSPPIDDGETGRVAAKSAEATKSTWDHHKHRPAASKVNDRQHQKFFEPGGTLKALARKPRGSSRSVSASASPQVHTVNESNQGCSDGNSSARSPLTSGASANNEATSLNVWDSPRIVAKVCLFLPLSKLLLVRRCNKTFLQAAQFRMRFILYKSLHVLLNQSEGPLDSPSVVVEGHHCPISADALIKLLGLEADEVEAVKAGDLPPAYPDEALTPRMQDVVAAIIQERKAREVWQRKEPPAGLSSKYQARRPVHHASPPSERAPPVGGPPIEFKEVAAQEAIKAKQQRLLLDQQMKARQAEEETRLRNLLDAERELEQRSAVGYDEAAGPVAPPSALPPRGLRQALVRATTTPFPSWLFDAAALLLRATFQVCCNSLSAPPLKDLIPLFVPRCRPGATAEVPSRADSYLWAKMARISGYAMHLVIDQTWPPRREAAVRLVARPLTDPAVLTSGAGADDELLQQAAVEGGGAASLVLRPAVVDSLELKMSKLNPEFIAEFICYGKQQQLLHSGNPQFLLRGEGRQYKASRELVLLMDLYEWLAAVLTHNQHNGLCLARPTKPLARAAASHSIAKGQSTRAGRRKIG